MISSSRPHKKSTKSKTPKTIVILLHKNKMLEAGKVQDAKMTLRRVMVSLLTDKFKDDVRAVSSVKCLD